MLILSGYTVSNEIYKSTNSTIFRAVRNADQVPVVVKFINKEYPTDLECSYFLREYELTRKFSSDAIIKAYDFVKYNNSYALILEDFGGESLDTSFICNEFELKEKIALFLKLTNALIEVHQKNIIHKDINPSNIVMNVKTGTVKLIDFGISSELTRETLDSVNLSSLAGTLDYISPEQTGRMNRPVDCRADLYSMGATFYELLTGKLPFYGNDDVEIVYAHIARIAQSPVTLDSMIPQVLSDIIMKLLSKAPEDRYQSAKGLKKDLEYCQSMINSSGAISFFPLGRNDFNDHFQIPHTLYGRELEIEKLTESFNYCADGNTKMLLVSGYSGIGKSSLIHEIHKPVAGRKGYFISGKFDQFERDVPYYAITQAFTGLIRQILSEPQVVLDTWNKRIVDALGPNTHLIIDIIPELEQITGPQPALVDINPLDAQNRFQLAFRQFLSLFANETHPLALFIDDLQWSDHSTLDLIKNIITSSDVKYVLIMVSYRDNEIRAGHPLEAFIDFLNNNAADKNITFDRLLVGPLLEHSVNKLIADTLHSNAEATKELTSLIYKKTHGNPFYINQVLTTLYHENVFIFNTENGQWQWDISEVEKSQISDNVIDLVVASVNKLPAETASILKIAACIGTKFDLKMLAKLSNTPLKSIGLKIWGAIEKEIIYPIDENYLLVKFMQSFGDVDFDLSFKFQHDRIRQALYTLIPETEKPYIHLQIGRQMLMSCKDTGKIDIVFDIVNNMNIGKSLIESEAERIELSDLNRIAADKARKSTAFSSAVSYYETARDLMTETEWAKRPGNLFHMSIDCTTCALLSGNIMKAVTLCDQVSKLAVTSIEKAIVSNIKMLILEFQGKMVEAIDEIRATLRLFNIQLPSDPQEIGMGIQTGIGKMQGGIARLSLDKIADLPVMTDPEKQMVMLLLYQVIPPALITNPPLFMATALMMFDLSLTYGTTPFSAKCFTDCAIIQCTALADYKTANKLCDAAFAIINKFNAESLKAAIYFCVTYSSYWRTHFSESLRYYDMSYQTGRQTGDIQHASYAIAHKVFLNIHVGKNLQKCKEETDQAIIFLKEAQTAIPMVLARLAQQTISKFTTSDTESTFEQIDNELLGIIKSTHNVPFEFRFYQYTTMFNIIHDNMIEAEKWNTLTEQSIFAALSDFPVTDHYLFQGLILINKFTTSQDTEKPALRDKITVILEKLRNWSENCEVNFAHKYYLLTALTAIIDNKPLDVITGLFDQALTSIHSSDFTHMKAYINECQGKFWLSKGIETVGKAFIRDAHYLYSQWGGTRKTAMLEKQYPQFFMSSDTIVSKTGHTRGTTTRSIDIMSIMKSSQAISSEIRFDKLLTILIQTTIENAGAQCGYLLLRNDKEKEYTIEAMKCERVDTIKVMEKIPYTQCDTICHEIIQYVIRTKKHIVLDNACYDETFRNNEYIRTNEVKSVLCLPIVYQNMLKGIVYLENNLTPSVFTAERLEILMMLASQASISIENAQLYETLEDKVRERTIQLKFANEQLKELSLHDPLTNLHNRRYAYEFVSDQAVKFIKDKVRSMNNDNKRLTSPRDNVLGIFLIDIDHFKDVNDTYGHKSGDNALVIFSDVLRKLIRKDDFIIRWGGEEILIILNNTSEQYLELFAGKILSSVKAAPIEVADGKLIHITCSIGYTEMPSNMSAPELLTLEQTINLSDFALYLAKAHGRNIAVHLSAKEQESLSQEYIDYLLRLNKNSAINDNYISVEYIKHS
jgi:diguanylate cyclase (GGDEF)-like protein